MSEGFRSIHFNAASMDDAQMERAGSRPMARRSGPAGARAQRPTTFETEEAAARFYLSNILGQDERPGMRGLTAPSSPLVVPDLKLRDSKLSPLTDTSVVRFVQTKSAIPIFGTTAVVEMDHRRELLSVDAQLAEVEGTTPVAALSPLQAIETIAAFTKTEASSYTVLQPPELTFYHDDEKNSWHLAWFVRNVPAAPEEYFEGLKSHGRALTLVKRNPQLDYIVDAHNGDILLYWSSRPTHLPMIVKCTGLDDDGMVRTIWGSHQSGEVALKDPLRRIQTYDLGGGSIDDPPPTTPVCHTTSNFDGFSAAVSAHYHATVVSDFLRLVLMRDGVDDKGMEIISYVNCTSPKDQVPPEWDNAAWWKQCMWYGQTRDGSGELRSFARHLDIIAHELAHGVTEFTADLVYVKQSGALNESFSDIFGLIIKNWNFSSQASGGNASTWDWEIGSKMGHGGAPLRDMRDPTRTGDPDHMNDYSHQRSDNGGVHTNSNIHNKAAYNLLNAQSESGTAVLTPHDVITLYYLTLNRLDKVATFSQTRATLINVAQTYFLGDPDRQQKLDAIGKAYDDVGIQ